MTEYNHHIGWLQEVQNRLDQATPLTDAERKQFTATCEHVLSQNPTSAIATRLLNRINTVSTSVESILSASVESREANVMKEVVAEAVRLGIIREEIFPAKQPSILPAAYLLSSSHPADDGECNDDSDVISSQVELFQLAHLMHRSGMKTPIHVEGRCLGRGYSCFPKVRPTLEKHGKNIDIHDPQAQEYFFENPDKLATVMHEYMGIARQHGLALPIFYAFTAYPHIEGVHTDATHNLIENYFTVWLPFYVQFMAKYGRFLKGLTRNDQGMIETKIQCGWYQDGTPALQIGEEGHASAQEIMTEFGGYLTYADMSAEIDAAREEDLADIFECKMATELPMGFAGKGHELVIARLVNESRALHALTPASSIQHDSKRRTLPINDRRCTMLYVDVAQKMVDIARSLKRREA